MLFSVVIPVFNRPTQFAACLASLAAQRCRDFETIVVDDASTEDIAAVAHASGLPVRLQRQAVNAGPGAARNAGLAVADGEYVAFLDSDDTWFPWTLELYADVIRRTGAPSFLAGRQASSEPSFAWDGSPARWETYPDYLSTAPHGVWIAGCAVVIHREKLRQAGGFVSQRINAEDSDLWLRLGAAPGFVEITEPPVFRYHQLPGSLVTMNNLTQLGIQHLVSSEQADQYPGGIERRRERRRIIGRHVRPPILDALKARDFGYAWTLYRRVFRWQVEDSRWKFLLGFWLILLKMWLSRPVRTPP